MCDATDTSANRGNGFRIDEWQVWTTEPTPRNVALQSEGAKATGASRTIEDFPGAYGPQLAIDGKTGARFISSQNVLTIEFAVTSEINRVVFSSAKGESKPDQSKFVFPAEYRIEVSQDGQSWTQVASGDDRVPVSEAHKQARSRRLVMSADQHDQMKELDREIQRLDGKIRAIPALRSAWVGTRDQKKATGPFHVFVGGSPKRHGEVITPSSLSMIPSIDATYDLPADSSEHDRRMKLADWLVDKSNPLSPRVLANRLWHYHFGTGIVSTPSDFGYMGGPPSHPELLDWLAGQLIENNWQLKPMHKLIMTSDAYRQSGIFRAAAKVDSDARLLWRFPPRRLSAEEIRDTMLAVSGRLDRRMAGPGFRLYQYLQDNVATYVPLDEHPPETFRRAIYHQNARASRIDLMTEFDQPDCAFSTGRRVQTTTPLQALTSLNHQFTLEMASSLADRISREAGSEAEEQIRRAYTLCYGRAPDSDEQLACAEFAKQHGFPALCRVLLNTSELIYVQ